MIPGKTASLEVLKFTVNDFSFHWTKEGSRRQIQTAQPNVVTFNGICEEDYGYYRCEVKEAGRVVITVYRGLFKEQSSVNSTEHLEPLVLSTSSINDSTPSK